MVSPACQGRKPIPFSQVSSLASKRLLEIPNLTTHLRGTPILTVRLSAFEHLDMLSSLDALGGGCRPSPAAA